MQAKPPHSSFMLRTASQSYDISHFTLKNWGLSCDYVLDVLLNTSDHALLPGQFVTALIDKVQFPGYLFSLVESTSGCIDELRLGIQAPLKYKLRTADHRVFNQVLLSELIENVMSVAGFKLGIDFEIHLSSDPKLDWLQQRNQSSYVFLRQLLLKLGICYGLKWHKNRSLYLFTDEASKFLAKHKTALNLRPPMGFNASGAVRDLKVEKALGTQYYRSSAYKPELGRVVSQSKASDASYDVGQRVLYDDEELLKPAAIRDQAQDKSNRLCFSLDAILAMPGQAIAFEEDLLPESSYFIREIAVEGWQEAKDGNNKRFAEKVCSHEKLTAKYELSPSLSGLSDLACEQAPSINTFQRGLIEKKKSHYPGFYPKGEYKLRLHQDPKPEEHHLTNPLNGASKPLRNAHYYHGNGYGLNIPFEVDTEVMVGYLNGSMHAPIILGACSNVSIKPLVSKENPNQFRLHALSGSQFVINEAYKQTDVWLSDPTHRMMLSLKDGQTETAINLSNKKGSININAHKKVEMNADNTYQQTVQQNHRSWVVGEARIDVNQGYARVHCKTSQFLRTTEDLNITSKKIGIYAQKNCLLKSQNEISFHSLIRTELSSLMGDLYCATTEGRAQFESKKQLTINTPNASLSITRSGMMLKTGGVMVLNATSIEGV